MLLILAGISIATLSGDNGTITKAIQSKKETKEAEDIEQLKLLAIDDQMHKKKTRIGTKLQTVYFNAIEDLKSIYDSETGEKYEENWHYITPEDAPKLNLDNSYLLNYETAEVIKYDENKHRMLTNELLCIKEDLVYTVDAKNRSSGENWGDAILHNFNFEDENSGWTDNSLSFDGIDDGIEVEDKSDYSNGITLEMYCKLRGQTKNQLVQLLMMKRTKTSNGFFMFLGNNTLETEKTEESIYRRLTVYIGGSSGRLITDTYLEENVPIYITYTFNPKEKEDRGILYINGQKTQTTNIGNIENIVSVQNDTNIQIGSDVHKSYGGESNDNRYPFNGEIYATRIYNRPLTEQEVKYNYDITVNNQ